MVLSIAGVILCGLPGIVLNTAAYIHSGEFGHSSHIAPHLWSLENENRNQDRTCYTWRSGDSFGNNIYQCRVCVSLSCLWVIAAYDHIPNKQEYNIGFRRLSVRLDSSRLNFPVYYQRAPRSNDEHIQTEEADAPSEPRIRACVHIPIHMVQTPWRVSRCSPKEDGVSVGLCTVVVHYSLVYPFRNIL